MPKVKRLLNAALTASPRGVLGTASDLIGVLVVVFGGTSLILEGELPQSVLAGVISGLALVFLGISFQLQRRLLAAQGANTRSVQSGRALPKLAESVANLARGVIVVGQPLSMFLIHAESGCRALAEMYEIGTGHPCRVTVLEAYAPPVENQRPGSGARLAVRRLCSSYPASGTTHDEIDWVDENTDFTDLFESGSPHFFCNDLPKELGEGYRNSHWTRQAIAEMRKKNSFPYRSTIVWPVRAWKIDAQGGAWDLTGFVCVDSTEAGVFDQGLDVAAGEAFASAVYLGLAPYQEGLRKTDENGGET